MSAAIPRPSRPSNGPPTMALPALPVGKTRKSTGGLPTPAAKLAPTTTPRTGLRAPSASHLPPATPPPTTALPQPRTVSGINGAGRTLRKTVSINSFPHPPRGDNRVTSLPPSPLSGGLSNKAKAPTAPNYHLSGTPSLLNGTGDGKAVARGSTRNSDGILSVSSPPQSRSSSAQDSYSTSATQYEDIIDIAQQKLDSSSSKRVSKADGKGNVIVSVRVRPDASGQDHGKTEGEWMVDGRKSLIGYRGKEGGDYFYGEQTTRRPRSLKHEESHY